MNCIKAGKLAVLASAAGLLLVGCARPGWQQIRAKARQNDVFVRGMELGSAKYEARRVDGGVRLTAWGETTEPVEAVCLAESPERANEPRFTFHWEKAEMCDGKKPGKFITEGWFVIDDKKKQYVMVYDRDGGHVVPIVKDEPSAVASSD